MHATPNVENAKDGMARAIAQVTTMLAESGHPVAAASFDVDKWLTRWMELPVGALGGRRPIEYMDSLEGQETVLGLLAMMQTGAYA